MGGRGTSRGRGGRGGIFKNHDRSIRTESVLDRLGKTAYSKNNDRLSSKKYKFYKPSVTTSSIATLPAEAKIKMLSKKFLKTYYDIFDSPGRANLESQYNADAIFSISATYPAFIQDPSQDRMPPLGRNLLEVPEPAKRISLLATNKTNIANALRSEHFSPTEHLVNFLSCDVPFYIANPMSVISMHIVVSGVFKDTSETTNPLKAFTRVFVLKQVSADKQGEPIYEIFNDLFMLQLPTPDQIKRFHHESQIVKRTSAQPEQRSSALSAAKSQEEMIQQIMLQTKMNKVGSRKLLDDCKWDMEKSIAVFNILFSTNKVPQEFFTP